MASLLRHLDSHDPKKVEEESMLQPATFDDEDEPVNLVEAYSSSSEHEQPKLGLRATAKLSFEFCLLWVRSDCLLFCIICLMERR